MVFIIHEKHKSLVEVNIWTLDSNSVYQNLQIGRHDIRWKAMELDIKVQKNIIKRRLISIKR